MNKIYISIKYRTSISKNSKNTITTHDYELSTKRSYLIDDTVIDTINFIDFLFNL